MSEALPSEDKLDRSGEFLHELKAMNERIQVLEETVAQLVQVLSDRRETPPMPNRTELAVDGEQLRELRANLRLSQAEMAEKFLVSRRTYQDWERGTSGISGPAIVVFNLIRLGKL